MDVRNSQRLRALVPKEILFVAESGIRTSEDIQILRDAGVNGVLIGETLMRAPDKKAMLDQLRGVSPAPETASEAPAGAEDRSKKGDACND